MRTIQNFAYLCIVIRHKSECSAVGSALRSGRRGRAFESPHSDLKTEVADTASVLFSTYSNGRPRVRCGELKQGQTHEVRAFESPHSDIKTEVADTASVLFFYTLERTTPGSLDFFSFEQLLRERAQRLAPRLPLVVSGE